MMIETIENYERDNEKWIITNPLAAHIVVVIFGISAWIGVNGIYVQLPLLVESAPESWNLAAYLVVMIQAANIGPAVYTLAKKLYPSLNESLCIFGVLLTGTLSIGLLAFLHDRTARIAEKERSVTLFVCSFFSALVGCTSSVLFMPYLRNCSDKYLASYFIGEGLSGVLPSVVAFFQGVSGNAECAKNENGIFVQISSEPRFSPKHYFIFIFAILLLSLCTFRLLRNLPSVRNANFLPADTEQCENIYCTDGAMKNQHPSNNYDETTNIRVYENDDMSFARIVYSHLLVGIICFLGNGFLPGIQTYSCLPYGNVAFHLTVTLANIANPTACLIYLWIDSVNFNVLDGLSFFGILTCTYATFLAIMSPFPPLRESVLGATFAVAAWVLLTGIISYLKISITSIVRNKLGPKGLLGVGIVMQLGSACGALVSFGIINYTTLFHQHKPCANL